VDYTETLNSLAEMAWLVLGLAPLPDQAFGYKLAEARTRMRVQAYVLETQRGGLVAGVNEFANHSPFLAKRLAAIQAGQGGLWVIPALVAIAPFVMQSAAAWGAPLDANHETVAAGVEQRVTDYFGKMAEMAGVVAAAAATAPPDSEPFASNTATPGNLYVDDDDDTDGPDF